jgi:hypothetical protein
MRLPKRANCLVDKPREKNADMKRFTSSVGLVALSAISLQAAYAPGLSPLETSKRWTISAGLRGFYDDNYTTASEPADRSSYGFELNPRLALNLPLDQTLITASLEYSGKYFEDRSSDEWDHGFDLSAALDHSFSERYSLKLTERFTLAQEPDVFSGAVPLRINGDNIHNQAGISFLGDFTRELGYELGYKNDIYDYDNAVRSAQLDRIEHLISASLRWFVQPQTTAVLSYQFRSINYTSDDLTFGGTVLAPATFDPKLRDTTIHYVIVGADHTFNPNLKGSVRVGGTFAETDDLNQDSTSPYADLSLTYTYAPGSFATLGFKYDRTQTDVTGTTVATATSGADSATAYLTVNHKLTEKISATALGVYQNSSFEGGTANSQEDTFYSIALGLSYAINVHFSVEAGYTFDKLDSDLGGRSYDRNRGYVGVRATY